MGSEIVERPHVLCIPYPAQGHINPMLKLAKLLHGRGFYITFVNTEFNHQRLLRSRGPDSLNGYEDFRFETIPDGLPPSNPDATQDIQALCESTSKNCLAPFRSLVTKLNDIPNAPRVSCIVADGVMSFTLDAADELRIPEALFWTPSACAFMCCLHYPELINRGITPFKDESYLTNGHLDTPVDWIPGMKGMRLRDVPTLIRTTDPDDIILNFVKREVERAPRAMAVILNTFDDFECDVLDAMKSMLPPIYTIGPISNLTNQFQKDALKSTGSNLWKEDSSCLEWLDKKEPNSVVYVNYGSITVMTAKQMEEFAWGLADSNHPFLWVIRPDLVSGESAMMPPEFVAKTKDRSMLVSWCPQEQVLRHPSVGVFLTHCGWNSILESVCGGVPLICWPFFADQQTNCRYACTEWGIGKEIDGDVRRDEVKALVREMMEGEKGAEVRKRARKWKELAEAATSQGGSSFVNLDKLVNQLSSFNGAALS